MIQRKQTIFLILAIICFAVNAALPLGYVIPDAMGLPSTINGLGVVDGNTGEVTCPFFAAPLIFLALSIAHALSIIFMYKNRKAQMTNCYTLITSVIVEYIICGFIIWKTCIADTSNHYGTAFGIYLPLVAIAFILLAHKGISDDEKLVRAADRIR